jgi:hypothetical protein
VKIDENGSFSITTPRFMVCKISIKAVTENAYRPTTSKLINCFQKERSGGKAWPFFYLIVHPCLRVLCSSRVSSFNAPIRVRRNEETQHYRITVAISNLPLTLKRSDVSSREIFKAIRKCL